MKKPLLNCSIIGGGIGGLTLALALKRRGFEIEVYERAAAISEIGAGLLLSPNAVSVLYALGLKAELDKISICTPVWQVLNTKGKVLSQIRSGTRSIPSISLRRSDLQQLLASKLDDGKIHLGYEATSMSSEAGGQVQVDFSNGKSVSTDLVAAADGIHSAVRNIFFEDAVKRPSNYVGWRAMVDFVPTGWEKGLVTETWGKGMRFGLAPTGANCCYWYASANRDADEMTSVEDRKPLLMWLFSEWHFPAMEILANTPADQILETIIAERPLPKVWNRGRVVLLGDAAHAMTPNLGQGAAMAIEDAWELSECLASQPDVSTALQLYGRRRALRVQMVQWASRMIGRAIQTESRLLASCRDNLLKATPSALAEISLRWLFSPRV